MKLLTRTVRNYVFFSTVLLLVSSPLFYFCIQTLFIHKMDKELLSHKKEFHELLPFLKTESDFEFFSKMNDEILLERSNYLIKTDSFLTKEIYCEETTHINPIAFCERGLWYKTDHMCCRFRNPW